MKKNTNIFLFLVLVSAIIFSCKKDKPVDEPVNFGYNYFPEEIGRYVIYLVDSMWHDKNNFDTTIHYQLMEKITAIAPDNSGRPTLRIERYYKYYNPTVPYDAMNWSAPRVWTANKTQTTLEKKEENITYLKLIFPVREGKLWNGNVYNILGERDYEIESADNPLTINNIYFDSVAVIKQFEEINLVKFQVEKEKFARNVGLIYKQKDSLSLQQHDANDNPPFDDTVGYKYIQKIISYGK
ncbi:MAG: hypothetical protein HY841_14670 [Bacteroidetes bacterium]|nr:hypothetical protein [Bacteroidota bacterium]